MTEQLPVAKLLHPQLLPASRLLGSAQLFFSPRVLERGKAMAAARRHQAAFYEIIESQQSASSSTYTVMSVVPSETTREMYEVTLRVAQGKHDVGLSTHCTCPVSSWCKHAAAIILRILADADQAAREHIAPPAAKNTAAELASHSAAQDAENFAQWHHWLANFDRNGSQTAIGGAPYGARTIQKMEFVLGLGKALVVKPVNVREVMQKNGKPALRTEAVECHLRTSNYALADLWLIYPEHLRPALELLYLNPTPNLYQSTEFQLLGILGERTLQALFAHPVHLEKHGRPLHLGPDRAITAAWTPQADGTLKLIAALASGATDQPVHAAPGNIKLFSIAQLWYVDQDTMTIGRANGMSATQYHALQGLPPLRPGNAQRASTELLVRPALCGLTMPAQISTRVIDATPSAVLRVAALGARADQDLVAGALFFVYDNWRLTEESTGTQRTFENDVCFEVRRNPQAEAQFKATLRAFGLLRDTTQAFSALKALPWRLTVADHYCYDIESWHAIIAPLAQHGITVELDPALQLEILSAPQDWFAELDDTSDSNWFELALGIVINGEKHSLLPILVQALASRQLSLRPAENEAPDAVWLARLDEKRRVPLPLGKVRALIGPIMEWLSGLSGDKLRLPALRAALLNELSDTQIEVRGSAMLEKLAALFHLQGAVLKKPALVPKTLKATLRGYQQDGLNWLTFLGTHGLGGLLADDMGLGKTIQVIAHILVERAAKRLGAPVLIVMPTTLIPNWQNELARFAPVLKVLTLHGAARGGLFDGVMQHDVVLTTYPLLPRDEEKLSETHFALAVFDEAQAIKNARSKAAIVARRIRAKRRLVMSGTPVENHLGELFAQVELVLPGLLGPERMFTQAFRTPIEKGADAERSRVLETRLKPFLLRRTKNQVASDLPAKTEITRTIELEGPQRDLYETLRLAMHKKVRDAVKARGIKQSSIIVLDALLKLRQACCDPALVKLPSARKVLVSAKRELLQQMLKELLAEGRRVLVFSQFTEMLDLIEQDLRTANHRYARLDGNTKDRRTPVEQFQSLAVPIMLISLKAGGVGLNLTAADTVIHYDPWWNPAVENQASDRAHRIGQDKPVFVYKLVCRNTVEEKIVALQAKKAALADAILAGGSSVALSWDSAAIAHLFGVDSLD